MIDIKLLRNNPKEVKLALASRGDAYNIDEILKLDKLVREKQFLSQTLVAERNKIAKEIGMLKSQQKNTDDLLKKVANSKTEEERLVSESKKLEEELYNKLSYLPNLPQNDVPLGANEQDNKEIRQYGKKPQFSFQPKEHYELGTNLGMMDFQKAAQVAGSRFVYLNSQLAKLERALGSFMLDVHTKKFGYQEYSVPVLMNAQSFFNTAQLPKFQEDLFSTNLQKYLISTGEIPLTNLASNKVFLPKELPLRLTALSLCFRAEAGAAGKDTKGMLRQHQFSKVELVSICEPSRSNEELEYMVNAAEEILKLLEIPYRVMLLCTGDMGFSSSKTYDIEAWLPGQNQYREISSCSNCTDFQARRMNAKTNTAAVKLAEYFIKRSNYTDFQNTKINKEAVKLAEYFIKRSNYTDFQNTKINKEAVKLSENFSEKPIRIPKSNNFVHTLNGSGLAVGRTLIAVLENYQQADGSILIPKVLQPYMDNKELIK